MGVVHVSLGTAPVTVQPGGQAADTFVVRNTSDTIQRVGFEATGAAASWTTFEPASVSLLPGAEREVEMRFGPPRSPAPPAGALTVAVKVTPRDAPQDGVVERRQILVTPVQGIRAEIDPITSSGFRSGRHVVSVVNEGNAALGVHVTAADPAGRVMLQIVPARLTVGPGTTARSKIKVRLLPTDKVNRKDDTPRFFKVTVQSDGTPARSVTMDAALRIRRVPVRRLSGVLGLLATFVTAAVVLSSVLANRNRADDRGAAGESGTTGVTATGSAGSPGTTGPTPTVPPPSGVASGEGERAALALGAPCQPTDGLQVRGTALITADGSRFREFADNATAVAARDLLKRHATLCTIGNAANDDSELTFHPPPLQRTPAPTGSQCTPPYDPGSLKKAASQTGRTFAIEVGTLGILTYSNEIDRDRAFVLLQGHTQICWLGGGALFDTLFDWSRALAYF